ncbi:hypothetical protein D3C87_1108180 [compost metagenome]
MAFHVGPKIFDMTVLNVAPSICLSMAMGSPLLKCRAHVEVGSAELPQFSAYRRKSYCSIVSGLYLYVWKIVSKNAASVGKLRVGLHQLESLMLCSSGLFR